MKKTMKTLALCLVIGTMAVSCQKEENINPTTETNCTSRTVSYVVNGETHLATLQGENAWAAFLQSIFALAKEGYEISFRDLSSSSQTVEAKETVTFSTSKEKEAQEWCLQMAEKGYTVNLSYDKTTGMYNCTAKR